MTRQPARPGVRASQALGLTIFLATAAFLVALLLSGLGSAFESVQKAAVAFSTLCAAVAAFGMLIDAADLWVRGRKMTAYSVKMFRSLVFVAVLGALVASLFGGNSLVIVFLAPAMIVYLVHRAPSPGRLGRRERRAVQLRLDREVAAEARRQEAPLTCRRVTGVTR